MAEPVRIDIPREGLYQIKLIKGGPWIAVRIWFGFPRSLDPDEIVDRMPAWQAERDGEEVPVDQVWPDCSDEPIIESEYQYLLARSAHARAHHPSSPYANPRRRIDLNTVAPPIFKR